MKALTLYNPWAYLVATGNKQIETRSWNTSYRGPLAIHASKNYDYINYKCKYCATLNSSFCNATKLLYTDQEWRVFISLNFETLGCVIATCNLVAVRPTTPEDLPGNAYWINEKFWSMSQWEFGFGNYSIGRYKWFLDDIQRLPKPIPAKGKMMLWEWDEMNPTPPAPQTGMGLRTPSRQESAQSEVLDE